MKLWARAGKEMLKRRRLVTAPVTFSEEGGVRYLHFGTEWIQGAMRLRKPDWLELEYAQQMMVWMLFIHEPRALVQLGLGCGSLTKFCFRQFRDATVEAIEINPAVIVAARTMFKLPENDERLSVLESDAWEFVADSVNHGRFDAVQVDLYDASARGPVLDSLEFYQNCRRCLNSPGVLTVNLFGDHPSFVRNMRTLREAFEGRIVALPEVHDGNRVAIGFNGPPLQVSVAELYDRAVELEIQTSLPAQTWVHGLVAEAAERLVAGGFLL